ncbi:MAG: type II toxin-antitoxin system ParD family antitoxin [Caulobacteraceae bacterium]
MRSTQQLSVTLPDDMAANVRAKVTSGEYASESEVVREGLRALQERDHAIDDWLRNEVVPAYEALKSDPSSGLSIDEVRAGLRERHERRPRPAGREIPDCYLAQRA